ncbi:hypothetical protein [Lactiplantibacillus plantarum]|uniref:hypothetical protein n=1 Tax=Lactiplantibacillus plantarum TaxID=1590 RepID=UPI002000A790|nr:hypothetical protein [Lactiplantibacillus plantarum]
MWEEIENFIKNKNFKLNENDYNYILSKLMPDIHRWAHSAYQRAYYKGVCISKEDFFSYFQETVWDCIQSYIDLKGKEYKLSHIVSHRIKLAEAMVWRSYSNIGTSNDKNHTQYRAAQLLPINFELVNNNFDFSNFKIRDQLNSFKKNCPTEAAVIGRLIAGYSPKEITKDVFDSDSYSSKYRKRINRIRNDFDEYIHR